MSTPAKPCVPHTCKGSCTRAHSKAGRYLMFRNSQVPKPDRKSESDWDTQVLHAPSPLSTATELHSYATRFRLDGVYALRHLNDGRPLLMGTAEVLVKWTDPKALVRPNFPWMWVSLYSLWLGQLFCSSNGSVSAHPACIFDAMERSGVCWWCHEAFCPGWFLSQPAEFLFPANSLTPEVTLYPNGEDDDIEDVEI